MRCFRESARLRCALVFAVVLTLRVAWCRLVPSDDPEGSNLLVNVVLAAIPTAAYAVIDRLWLRRRWGK